MSVVQLDIQKIEQLLNSATTSRQRKMYQALLDKALSQKRASTDSSILLTTPETEKKAKTKTKGQTETQKKTKTVKKNKKATPQSATTEASPAKQSTKPLTESKLTEEESEVPPQTELKSKSKKPQQHPDDEPTMFQALGTILAAPYLFDDLLKVAIDGRSYDLFTPKVFNVDITVHLKRS